MAVSISSRYRNLGIQDFADADGQTHPSVAIRRHSPVAPNTANSRYTHQVTGVEGIEYLAFRFYGNSESWWRIADANPLRFPLDVKSGDAVAIPSSDDVVTQQDRARTF
ncbi:MAG TPA: hypothetical protein VFY10_03865 [Dehalococcoidia bacterium]|nr:hypothetical protein [Dehalococcoidia bacterium]